jgi:hypothetical protein
MKKSDWLILVFAIMIIFFYGTWYHEYQHQTIFSHYGIGSKIEVKWFSMNTVPDHFAETLSPEDARAMTSSQELVDSIACNLQVIQICLVLIMAFMYINYVNNQEGGRQ